MLNGINDSLYLGMRNGAVQMIIPTGAELPYTSQTMTGFTIEAKQDRINIPIKSRNLDGTYRTIASGQISFKKSYNKNEYVAFTIHMGVNKVITMRAWTSENVNGSNHLEEGYVEIHIDNGKIKQDTKKVIPPRGSILQPNDEISRLLQLCQNFEREKKKSNELKQKINSSVTSICNCGNKADFAPLVLDTLEKHNCEEAKQRLLVIARRIAKEWTPAQRKRLSTICLNCLAMLINGFMDSSIKRNTHMQAIYTLSVCDEPLKLQKINILHSNSKYEQACLYTHAKTKTSFDWIKSKFERDLKLALRGEKSGLQMSAYAIGVVLRKDDSVKVTNSEQEMRIVRQLCQAISTGILPKEVLNCCVWALGFICDQRTVVSDFSLAIINNVLDAIHIDYLTSLYGYEVRTKNEKTVSVVTKMINGEKLNKDEEQYLLTKLELS